MRVYRDGDLYVVGQGEAGNRDRARFVCDGVFSWEENTGYDAVTVTENRSPATLKEWSEMMIEEIFGDTRQGKRMVQPLQRLVSGKITSAELNRKTNRIDIVK